MSKLKLRFGIYFPRIIARKWQIQIITCDSFSMGLSTKYVMNIYSLVCKVCTLHSLSNLSILTSLKGKQVLLSLLCNLGN